MVVVKMVKRKYYALVRIVNGNSKTTEVRIRKGLFCDALNNIIEMQMPNKKNK